VEIQDAGCIVKEALARQALLGQPSVLYRRRYRTKNWNETLWVRG